MTKIKKNKYKSENDLFKKNLQLLYDKVHFSFYNL